MQHGLAEPRRREPLELDGEIGLEQGEAVAQLARGGAVIGADDEQSPSPSRLCPAGLAATTLAVGREALLERGERHLDLLAGIEIAQRRASRASSSSPRITAARASILLARFRRRPTLPE